MDFSLMDNAVADLSTIKERVEKARVLEKAAEEQRREVLRRKDFKIEAIALAYKYKALKEGIKMLQQNDLVQVHDYRNLDISLDAYVRIKDNYFMVRRQATHDLQVRVENIAESSSQNPFAPL